MKLVPRMSTTTLIAIRFVTVLIALCMTACATGYHVPETPPKLGPDGWPVGVWKNEHGNEIRLYEDGTGSYWNKKTGITNDRVIWKTEGDHIRVDRWLINMHEVTWKRKFRGSEKAKRKIQEYCSEGRWHTWWVFDSAYPGGTVLTGNFFYEDKGFGIYSGNLLEYRGIKSNKTAYELVELASSVARKKREREKEIDRQRKKRKEELARQRQKEKLELERRTAPSKLILEARFKDESSLIPNKAIDAGEEASISLTITNQGKGTAVYARLKAETEYKNINLPAPIYIGNIGPGESIKASIKLTAGLKLSGGTIPLKVTCTEERGYAGYTIIDIPAAKLNRPRLVVDSYKINDTNRAPANGNGNGVPESGEIFELIARMKNVGAGNALNVNLSGTSNTTGTTIKKWGETFGRVGPGETFACRWIVSVSPTFDGDRIAIHLSASDARGFGIGEKAVTLKARAIIPILSYSYRIMDKTGRQIDGAASGFIENGEEGQLEVTVVNKGKAEAKDVEIAIHSNAVYFIEKQVGIKTIAAQSQGKPHVFGFQIPRALGNDLAEVGIRITQRHFPLMEEVINIPHRPFTP